jgi:hypothetical protein
MVYGGAATTDSAAPDAAVGLCEFMAAPENCPGWKAAVFQPLAN